MTTAATSSASLRFFHGTAAAAFAAFDPAYIAAGNVGFHFGTRAAALDRIRFLREQKTSNAQFSLLGKSENCARYRILECALDIRNPLRVEYIFGFSYGHLFETVEDEARRQHRADLLREINALSDEWMASDDDPSLRRGGSGHDAYNARLNRTFVRLFQALGYDGLVYANEIEAAADNPSSVALAKEDQSISNQPINNDSYVAFAPEQITILSSEAVKCAARRAA